MGAWVLERSSALVLRSMVNWRALVTVGVTGICVVALAAVAYSAWENTVPPRPDGYGIPCPIATRHDPAGLPVGPISSAFVRRGLAAVPRAPGVTYGRVETRAETRGDYRRVFTCTAAYASVAMAVGGSFRATLTWYDDTARSLGWEQQPDVTGAFIHNDFLPLQRLYRRGIREELVLTFPNQPPGAGAPVPGPSAGSLIYLVNPAPCGTAMSCGYSPTIGGT